MITINLCTTLNYAYERLQAYTPLGLLSVAAVAEAEGAKVTIKDLNSTYEYVNRLNNLTEIAEYLLDNKPDLLGFATICNSYPIVLRLAKECKKLLPEVLIVFGGPQASATALATLQSFPAVDFILAGEGEVAFGILLRTLKQGKHWGAVPNLIWRSTSGIVENFRTPLIAELDILPTPAYHLNPISFEKSGSIPIEAGRGCPYKCIYCSTSRYWGSRFRMKSAVKLVSEICRLTEEYHMDTVELVHDNFTSSPKVFREFCRNLRVSNVKVKWGCSVRIDSLDNALIKEIAESGCTKLFCGIESGARSVQRFIKKRMKCSTIIPNAEVIAKNGITFTGSFIAGFPDETFEDLRQTLLLMFKLRYAAEERNYTHLHLLSPLPGTPIQQVYKNVLIFDGQPSDISVSVLSDEDKLLIQKHPDIFSAFYRIPTSKLSTSILRKLYLIVNFSQDFPFTMFILWKQEKYRLIDLILSEVDNFKTDNINIFNKNRLAIVEHVFHFFETYLIPKVAQNEVLGGMMRYEYCTYMVKNQNKHIEIFTYDVELAMASIRQKQYDEPLVREWHPTGYIFVRENDEIKTVKLADSITQMLMRQTHNY